MPPKPKKTKQPTKDAEPVIEQVVCPEGAGPGSKISYSMGGHMVTVTVPPGVGPGQPFRFAVPAKVVKSQKKRQKTDKHEEEEKQAGLSKAQELVRESAQPHEQAPPHETAPKLETATPQALEQATAPQ